jgi:hypothetical protein
MSCGSIAAAGHVSVIRDLTDDQVGSGTVRTRIGLRYLYGRLTCLVVVGVNTIPCTSGQGGAVSPGAVVRTCRRRRTELPDHPPTKPGVADGLDPPVRAREPSLSSRRAPPRAYGPSDLDPHFCL